MADLSTAVEHAWSRLCEADDRTSPEEYPDMVLITQEELARAMDEAVEAAQPSIIERCAVAAEAQDRVGREWVRDSLWANLLERAGANVRALVRS